MTARTSAPATLRTWLEPGDVGAIVPERHGELIGSVAVVAESPEAAQLRWYLVAPGARVEGLGQRLLDDAIAFARAERYRRMILWTVAGLEAAGRRYAAAGLHELEPG